MKPNNYERFSGKKNRQIRAAIARGQCGFTLLEVLIATSILSVMMLLLFGSLKVCSRSWISGEEHIKASSQMTVVQNFFRTYLEGALLVEDPINIKPIANPDDNAFTDEEESQSEETLFDDSEQLDQGPISFQGNENELQFISVMPASAGRSGLQIFTIWLLNKGDTQDLIVTIVPFYPLLDDSQDIQEEISILDNVEKFAITYWGTKEYSYEPEWHLEWNEGHLPKLVRIEIELENESAWPAMIVSPKLALMPEEGE